jgi:hypothetical protein
MDAVDARVENQLRVLCADDAGIDSVGEQALVTGKTWFGELRVTAWEVEQLERQRRIRVFAQPECTVESAAGALENVELEVRCDLAAAPERVGADSLPGIEEEQLPDLVVAGDSAAEQAGGIGLQRWQDRLQDEASREVVLACEREQREQDRIGSLRIGGMEVAEKLARSREATERAPLLLPAG